MATTTTNLALIKPAGTDKIRIAQINSNMDVLDDKIGPVGNTSLQKQISDLNKRVIFRNILDTDVLEIARTIENNTIYVYARSNNVANKPDGGNWGSYVFINSYGYISIFYEDNDRFACAYALTKDSTNIPWAIFNTSLPQAIGIVASGDTATQTITAGQYVIWNGALYTAKSNIASGGTLSTSNLTAESNGGLNALKSIVDSLNSRLTRKNSYTTAFDITVGSSPSTHFFCDRVGKTVFLDVVFYAQNNVAINTNIGHVNGLSDIIESHVSAIGSNGTGARFLLKSSGILNNESALPANEWFSFTFVAQCNASI